MHKLMGRKIGMTQRFDEAGNVVVCTVVAVEPNVVTQVRRKDTDGYEAVQFGFGQLKNSDERVVARRLGKPRVGHFAKAGISPRRHLQEFRIDDASTFEVGQEFGVEIFELGAWVDVCGVTKGKGYQGVMKLHGFKGGPGAHGSGFHRHAGSTGMRSTPGRCLEGGKRASQMGSRRKTVQNLRVLEIDAERGLIFLCGSVPGFQGSLITLSPAVKRVK